MMKRNFSAGERGQSVILVVLMLTGLIAMLALVLDGGNFYTQRRAAQVAADAGALAGAREYCLTESNTAAINRAFEYAVTRNLADNADITVDGATGDVTVDASITFDTFFLGILGRPTMTAVASATGACDPATNAYVLPIAWSCNYEPSEENPDGYCEVNFWDEMDGIEDCDLETGDGDYIYIVVDSTAIEAETVCLEPDGSVPPAPPGAEIQYVDCNFDDDDDNDVELLSGGSKTWLDIGGTGGEPPEMIDWIQNGLGEPIYAPTWFAGQTGTVANVYRALHDYTLNKQVVIPVFDKICDGYPPDACPLQYEGEPIITASENSSADHFRVISFTLFYPSCVEAAGIPGSCPINNLLDLPPQVKSVEGCFVDGFNPSLGSSGGAIVDTGADVVYLKR